MADARRPKNTDSGLPSGSMSMFGGTVEPEGWLMCDGREVSRSTYAELFAAIGINHGEGDGSTTFNIPDMRGYFPRGSDDMNTARGAAGKDPDASGRTAAATGGATGAGVGSEQDDRVLAHSHKDNWYSGGAAGGGTSNYPGASSGTAMSNGTSTRNDTISTNSDGNNAFSSETRPKNKNVNFIIKV